MEQTPPKVNQYSIPEHCANTRRLQEILCNLPLCTMDIFSDDPNRKALGEVRQRTVELLYSMAKLEGCLAGVDLAARSCCKD